MTAARPPISIGRPQPPAALPDLRPGGDLLTVTAHPLPPGAVVMAVRGDLDLGTSPLLQQDLLAQLRHAGPHLIVDLTDLGFFGAAGLTVLVTVREAAMAAGGLSVVARAAAKCCCH